MQILFSFLSSGSFTLIYSYYLVAIILVCIKFFFNKDLYISIIKNPANNLLFLFGLFYCLFGDSSFISLQYYLLCPVLAFNIGWISVEVSKHSYVNTLRYNILAIIVGFGVHAFLNYSINVGHSRFELREFFTGEFRSATICGPINTCIFSLVIYYFIFEKEKTIRLVALTLFVISLLYALLLGTRTQFMILLAVNLFLLVIYLSEIGLLRENIKYFVIAIVVCLLLMLAYSSNLFGIKSAIDNSNLMKRFSSSDDADYSDSVRSERLIMGIENILQNPLKGNATLPYFHNFWLDIARVSGVVPLILMVMYTVYINVHMLRLFVNKELSKRIRYMLLPIYIGIQVNFLSEPILDGLLDMFLIFCVINGMVECFYYEYHYDF